MSIAYMTKDVTLFQKEKENNGVLPILKQNLVCELDGHPESFCFKWKLMIDSDIIDQGEFKDFENDEEETDRFLNILNKFSELKVKEVFKWYRDSFLSRSSGIIISRPYVCPEISDYKGCFVDRLRLGVMNTILPRFLYKNATVDVPFFKETNRLSIRFKQEGIQFIATMMLEDADNVSIDITAFNDEKVVAMEWNRNFFFWDLKKFIKDAIRNNNDAKIMRTKIQNTVYKICREAIENHLFETLHDGKIAIEKDVESGLEKLVNSGEISSYEVRCKLFDANRPNLYIDVTCSKDGEFEDLQIETLIPLTPES